MFKGGQYTEEQDKKVKEMLQMFEDLLGSKTYITGDDVTLADLSLATSMSLLLVSYLINNFVSIKFIRIVVRNVFLSLKFHLFFRV